MIKYLIVGLVAVGLLAGCREDTPVTKCKGQILSISGSRAEIVYQTSDRNYHEGEYAFDNYNQRDYYHVGQNIICYVMENGEIQEIATK